MVSQNAFSLSCFCPSILSQPQKGNSTGRWHLGGSSGTSLRQKGCGITKHLILTDWAHLSHPAGKLLLPGWPHWVTGNPGLISGRGNDPDRHVGAGSLSRRGHGFPRICTMSRCGNVHWSEGTQGAVHCSMHGLWLSLSDCLRHSGFHNSRMSQVLSDLVDRK